MGIVISSLSSRVSKYLRNLAARRHAPESATSQWAALPVLLLDPAVERTHELAVALQAAGFPTRIEGSAAAALQAMRGEFFATLIVTADLDNADCLARLDDLRRRATRTWMIVVSPRCDTQTCKLIFRHGGDACVAAPASADELIARLCAFRPGSRLSF